MSTLETTCHYCRETLTEDTMNLFPIGATADNKHRIYDWDKHLCEECYHHHCTKWEINMLEGE